MSAIEELVSLFRPKTTEEKARRILGEGWQSMIAQWQQGAMHDPRVLGEIRIDFGQFPLKDLIESKEGNAETKGEIGKHEELRWNPSGAIGAVVSGKGTTYQSSRPVAV